MLVAVYAVFAIAATARAGVQLVTRYAEAPTAYLLSAVRGGDLHRRDRDPRPRHPDRPAPSPWSAISIELLGVLAVGTLSLLDPAAFPRATVWSGFGMGYGFVPLVLPILGLIWLWRTRSRASRRGDWTQRAAPSSRSGRPDAP